MATEKEENFFTDKMHKNIFVFDGNSYDKPIIKEGEKYFKKTDFGRVYGAMGRKALKRQPKY